MLRQRFSTAVMLSLGVWVAGANLARADKFEVTVKNLDAQPMPEGIPIYLRAFRLVEGIQPNNIRLITVGDRQHSVVARIRLAGEVTEMGTFTALRLDGLKQMTGAPPRHITFKFEINDANLQPDGKDRVVLFEFFRQQRDTPQEVVPLIAISTDNKDEHKFSVAVPEPAQLAPPPPPFGPDCPPIVYPCCNPPMVYPCYRSRCRLFGR